MQLTGNPHWVTRPFSSSSHVLHKYQAATITLQPETQFAGNYQKAKAPLSLFLAAMMGVFTAACSGDKQQVDPASPSSTISDTESSTNKVNPAAYQAMEEEIKKNIGTWSLSSNDQKALEFLKEANGNVNAITLKNILTALFPDGQAIYIPQKEILKVSLKAAYGQQNPPFAKNLLTMVDEMGSVNWSIEKTHIKALSILLDSKGTVDETTLNHLFGNLFPAEQKLYAPEKAILKAAFQTYSIKSPELAKTLTQLVVKDIGQANWPMDANLKDRIVLLIMSKGKVDEKLLKQMILDTLKTNSKLYSPDISLMQTTIELYGLNNPDKSKAFSDQLKTVLKDRDQRHFLTGKSQEIEDKAAFQDFIKNITSKGNIDKTTLKQISELANNVSSLYSSNIKEIQSTIEQYRLQNPTQGKALSEQFETVLKDRKQKYESDLQEQEKEDQEAFQTFMKSIISSL